MSRPTELTPDDLLASASACRAALAPALECDWEVRARDMDWTCRRTLDHVVDVLFLYSAHLATLASSRRPPPRNGDLSASPAELLIAVESGAAVLAGVVRFAIEFIRINEPVLFGLTVAHLASLGMIGVGLLLLRPGHRSRSVG